MQGDGRGAPILVAEDDGAVRDLLKRVLRDSGFRRVHAVGHAHDVMPALFETGAQLLLLDLHMPDGSGFDVLTDVQAQVPEPVRPLVVVLTGDHSRETRHRALAEGAADFLTKPLDNLEVLLRIRNLLRTRALQRELERHNERLEDMVRERTAEVDRTQFEVLLRLSRAAEHRDDDTGQHTRRVANLAGALALRLQLDVREAELICRGALLHDIGKIGLPDSVLLKPGALTPEERGVMQRHTLAGAAILSGSQVRLLQVAEEIALCHHERWDGTGYPHGLAGEKIPIAARIVSVADTFDALISERPYKSAWPVDIALAEIRRMSGAQFDPAVVTAFIAVAREDPSGSTDPFLP